MGMTYATIGPRYRQTLPVVSFAFKKACQRSSVWTSSDVMVK